MTEHKKRGPKGGPRSQTEFRRKWGILAQDLARVEDVSVDAIHMRVLKFGTPFQRRSTPSAYESKYGYTLPQLAELLGTHPTTLTLREKKYGTVYEHALRPGVGQHRRGMVVQSQGLSWQQLGKYAHAAKPTWFTLEDALQRLEALNGV